VPETAAGGAPPIREESAAKISEAGKRDRNRDIQEQTERLHIETFQKRTHQSVPGNAPGFEARCNVFFSYEAKHDVQGGPNKEPNFASLISPILKQTVIESALVSVLECGDYETEAELEEAMSLCSIFLIFASDVHMRSKAGQHQLIRAIDQGMHIVAVIMPNYSAWPPSLKDGCWWDLGDKYPLAEYLYLATLVDLSLHQYAVYFDILLRLQEAEAEGEIEPQEPEAVWKSLRAGEFDEDDLALGKDEVAVMGDMLQLSKESVLVYRKWCLDLFVQVFALLQSLV
jgi:hypothetical protein